MTHECDPFFCIWRIAILKQSRNKLLILAGAAAAEVLMHLRLMTQAFGQLRIELNQQLIHGAQVQE